ATSLPAVVASPGDRPARTALLQGAARGGEALALAGLGLAHAMAQAVGGRYGLPHGAMNALCLPAGLRYASTLDPEAVGLFRRTLGETTVEELARLGGYDRLRDFGVPEADLHEIAEAAAARGGN